MIEDVIITHLNIIPAPGGDVMQGMKQNSDGYKGFGEAYFSQVCKGAVKAWKRHKRMTLNLMVPSGKVRFVFLDDRDESNIQLQEVVISNDNYCRLSVPPMIWFGFQGLSEDISILLNIANIEHDPSEVDRKNVEEIEFNWE